LKRKRSGALYPLLFKLPNPFVRWMFSDMPSGLAFHSASLGTLPAYSGSLSGGQFRNLKAFTAPDTTFLFKSAQQSGRFSRRQP
jgi:hypothetical protein